MTTRNSTPSPNENALRFIRDLLAGGLWGTITIKIEAGQVVHIRKEQNFKPDELPSERPRNTNASTTR